jgi:hypothetical protein
MLLGAISGWLRFEAINRAARQLVPGKDLILRVFGSCG